MHGISTRGVDDLVEGMGVDAGISKSEVSRLNAATHRVSDSYRYVTCQLTVWVCAERVFPGLYWKTPSIGASNTARTCWAVGV